MRKPRRARLTALDKDMLPLAFDLVGIVRERSRLDPSGTWQFIHQFILSLRHACGDDDDCGKKEGA